MSPEDNAPGFRAYEVRAHLPSRVFHESEGAFLFPIVPVRSGSILHFQVLSPASDIQPFHVLSDREDRCLSFVSAGPIGRNLGTAVLMTYPSWSESTRKRALREDEVFTSFKHESGIVVLTCLNKMTLITSTQLSERLHDFLTMM